MKPEQLQELRECFNVLTHDCTGDHTRRLIRAGQAALAEIDRLSRALEQAVDALQKSGGSLLVYESPSDYPELAEYLERIK